MRELRYPFRERAIRALKAGEAVSITGRIHTGRDRFHKHFAEGGELPVDFRDGCLYHCGPVILSRPRATEDSTVDYSVLAAGPTTSVRENPYEPDFIARSGVRIIIGKGGMDARTLEALREHGCVYVQAVGGGGAVYADAVRRVAGVSFLEEFGAAEAVWHFDVVGFRGIVAMDSHGRSLFDEIRRFSENKLKGMIK